jgi:hypothetical protein
MHETARIEAFSDGIFSIAAAKPCIRQPEAQARIRLINSNRGEPGRDRGKLQSSSINHN